MASFYERFLQSELERPGNVALEIQRHNGMEAYTYAELRRMAESVARWLQQNGITPGARLAILANNHPRWVAAYLGTLAAGCIAVPFDTAFHPDQVARLLKDSEAVLLFCDHKHLEVAQAATAGLPVRLALISAESSDASGTTPADLPTLDDMAASGPGNFTPAMVQSDEVACLLYTSGTTADPKGVMLTHANLAGEVTAICTLVQLGPTDAVLGLLPLFHSLAQVANLLLPLARGARVVYLETLNTTELLRALRERSVTAFAVVPQFFYLIHERIFKEIAQRGKLAAATASLLMRITKLARRVGWNTGKFFFRPIHAIFGSGMRFLVTGGSRFDPAIGEDFYALGIDILQAYGLTETSGGAFVSPPNANVIGSVGVPLPGVEARIAAPESRPDGPAVGEVVIRGPMVMKGYWNRPEATAEVLRGGWLYTGDLGFLDAKGNLFLTGRKKELIVLSNGKNIYPEEIEDHYQQSPYIKEICVIGLEAVPGDPSSERLHGIIVPDFDVLREKKIVNAKEVIRFDVEGLSAQLASTKRLGSYEIWQEDLPRTTTKKLKRFEIEKRVLEGSKTKDCGGETPAARPLSDADLQWLGQPGVAASLRLIRQAARTTPETVHPADNLELDLGLDSMQRVELLVALEQELGGNVEESRLADIYTVRDLLDAVLSSAGNTSRGESTNRFAGWQAVLDEPIDDPEVLALGVTARFTDRLIYLAFRLVQVIASDLFHLRVEGIEDLPLQGPCILSSNHQSFLDPIILGSLLPWEIFSRVFAVGTSEIFGSGFLRRVARWLRVIVVDPDANLIPAMRAGSYGLKHGRALILYPEGERSIDGTPKMFKKGAAILAVHQQVPIVPIAIEGFQRAWPRGKSFQGFVPLRVKFGKAIPPPPLSQSPERSYEDLTAELKSRVMRMWEELRAQETGPASPSSEP